VRRDARRQRRGVRDRTKRVGASRCLLHEVADVLAVPRGAACRREDRAVRIDGGNRRPIGAKLRHDPRRQLDLPHAGRRLGVPDVETPLVQVHIAPDERAQLGHAQARADEGRDDRTVEEDHDARHARPPIEVVRRTPRDSVHLLDRQVREVLLVTKALHQARPRTGRDLLAVELLRRDEQGLDLIALQERTAWPYGLEPPTATASRIAREDVVVNRHVED
jgi:hypothetical protein